MDFKNCLDKQKKIKDEFLEIDSIEEKYQKIISHGCSLPIFPDKYNQPENIVKGCQSILYLKTIIQNEKLKFFSGSDALISLGLASLLIYVYQNEPPKSVFKCPPFFLKEIGLLHILSVGRSNGLLSLYKKMQSDILQLINL